MIGIIDYNAGNVTSVLRAVSTLGFSATIEKNPEKLTDCEKLIFPGVGEARYAMEQIKKLGWDEFLSAALSRGVPLFGICLGSQIIFEHSSEGDVDCLGLLAGEVLPLKALHKKTGAVLQIPHIGWNNIDLTESAKSGAGLKKAISSAIGGRDFYFVHSYYIAPADQSVIMGTCDYGGYIPAVVHKGVITATQFHPEKSGKAGLELLKTWCEGAIEKPV